MDRIIEEIRQYMLQGYAINEIMDTMKTEMQNDFGGDVDKFYLLIKSIFDKARNTMDSTSYEKLKLLRKKHAEKIKLDKYKRVANKVKTLAIENEKNFDSLKDALDFAVSSVANYEGLSNAVVRNYTKSIEPDFYAYYFNNNNLTPKELEDIAYKIIDNNMYLSVASRLKHYTKMMEHVKENRPDLYEQIKATYASHGLQNQSFVVPAKTEKVFNNLEYFVKIILEFRVPLNELYEFVKETGTTFCDISINSSEDLMYALHSKIFIDAFVHPVKWYLAEALTIDDYTEYRIQRFKAFKEKYFTLNNFEEQKKYINAVAAIDLKSVKEKADMHFAKQSYNFTLDETRALVRWIYNYGMTRQMLDKEIFTHKVDKGQIVLPLESSEELYDKMLVDGYKRLNEYHQDVARSESFRKY